MMERTNLYTIFLKVSRIRVLIIGGGIVTENHFEGVTSNNGKYQLLPKGYFEERVEKMNPITVPCLKKPIKS